MKAGDVVWADFGTPIGSEPGFRRPAVVITADEVLQRRPRTIHVVPLTTNTTRAMPTEVPIANTDLATASSAQAHLCTVISVQRLTETAPTARIGPVNLTKIRETVAELLDL